MIYRDRLESDRLLTRFLLTEDAENWKSFLRNQEATKFFPESFRVNPDAQASAWIERQHTRYRENRFGLQGLIEKSGGHFIGQCGLLAQEVDGIQHIEVGYHILPQYWNKGFAAEAARLFLNYGFRELQCERIISIIHIDNVQSQRVATKNGLTRERRTKWNDMNVDIWTVNRNDFNSHICISGIEMHNR